MRKRKSLTRAVAVALLALFASLALPLAAAHAAEPPSNAGREFWVGFPTNYGGETQLTLYITGGTATTGTVTIPGESFSETFTVTPGAVTAVKLPEGAQMQTTDGIEEKGIRVSAEAPVVVYGLNDYPFTTDAYTALPTSVVGTSYTVLAFGSGLGGNSEFSVVATQNGTEVTITPSVEGGGGGSRPAGTPYTITLNQGQEYQLRATNNPEDLTGTKITSTAPVSVFGGEQCANIPNENYYACDHVVEQNIPEDAWGTSFLTVPLKTRSGGDDFQVVADQNETHVELNGSVVATLNAGQYYTQEVEGSAVWKADKPVELAQYSNSSSYDDTTGDPFMINIPPYQQFETEYTITTPVNSQTVFGNYVNLVVPKTAVGLVKIDGAAVPASEYSPIGSSEFEGAQLEIASGSHVITGNGQPFGAFMYGFSEYNGYGYFGGMSLAPVAEVTSVTLSPATETALLGTEQCVTATVTDQHGNALAGVRVDFTVTGKNTAEGSVFANGEGKATFCYKGANLGEDAIVGAVGNIEGTAAKTWVTELPKSTTTTTTTTPVAKSEVAAFGVAHLASSGRACVASSVYTASVHGSLIASVTFAVNGHKVATVSKPNSHGQYTARIKVPAGHREKLAISVTYTSASKVHSATLHRTLARCAAKPKPVAKPRFTG
jgi:IgGFc binding protein/Bacterial Ig-like domain (group 1)